MGHIYVVVCYYFGKVEGRRGSAQMLIYTVRNQESMCVGVSDIWLDEVTNSGISFAFGSVVLKGCKQVLLSTWEGCKNSTCSIFMVSSKSLLCKVFTLILEILLVMLVLYGFMHQLRVQIAGNCLPIAIFSPQMATFSFLPSHLCQNIEFEWAVSRVGLPDWRTIKATSKHTRAWVFWQLETSEHFSGYQEMSQQSNPGLPW